jgi:hypothetical protein
MTIVQAAVEACRLRLRPTVMTSFAFILGVLLLAQAAGPGAEIRQVLGTADFSGMLGVTIFGLVLTLAFYVGMCKLSNRLRRSGKSNMSRTITTPVSKRYYDRRPFDYSGTIQQVTIDLS